jgi:glucosyl-dolichyl phosphate glucuronosyltransferase
LRRRLAPGLPFRGALQIGSLDQLIGRIAAPVKPRSGVWTDFCKPPCALCLAPVRVSHIIATKRRPQQLREALESSLADLPADAEIIVVDGDERRSAEPIVEEIRAGAGAGREIAYIECEPSSTHQRNVGIDAAHGEVVVFTDDDAIVQPGMFATLLAAYEDASVVGATGHVIESDDGRIGSANRSRLRRLVLGGGEQGTMTSFGFRRPILDYDEPRDVQYMPGTLMSARRSVAAEVRFDELLGGYALGEDDDFSYRLSRRGRVVYLPAAVVHHQAIGTRTMDRRVQDRLVVINRSYLFRKNFRQTARAKLGFAALIALLLAHRVVNRQWSGVRGLLDGLVVIARAGPHDGPAAGPS